MQETSTLRFYKRNISWQNPEKRNKSFWMSAVDKAITPTKERSGQVKIARGDLCF